jgi:hypothetical protein
MTSLKRLYFMTVAPFASTIVALALVPVAFLFCHAFLSGRRRMRFHPVTGILAVVWDLSVSIGYMVYRSLGGAVEGVTLRLTPSLNAYFMVHVPIAVLVMLLEFGVLGIGLWQVTKKVGNKWHGRLTKVLFFIWWFAFLSGEMFYIVIYVV